MVHCDGADGGDFFWGDDGGFVAEGVADVGKDGGDRSEERRVGKECRP